MTLFRKKEFYSPRDIALFCSVEPSVVEGWLDAKRLSFVVLPGFHRRVPHAVLEKFMVSQGFEKPACWLGEFSKFRVLVVEDDQDLLEIMGDFLVDELRLEVKRETNGFSAGLQIASWQPDLILLDFVMPEVSGFEIMKKLKENPETCDIPVLAVTSLKGEDQRQAVLNAGVSDFIGKPFYSEEFLKKIRTLLGIVLAEPAKGSS
ncbi:MAG: response regulator [Candidatus Omnitrophica bacterium]|nr:response regulator [Candidatus Omnitrophota bacterium]